MTLDDFIARLGNDDTLLFAETMALIDDLYDFTPMAFSNGPVDNAAGENQGSCKVFAFGKLNGLDEARTLACFGEHYRDVLADPDGTGHANIRAFMAHGWEGVDLAGSPLEPRRS
jgi:hypothetical protein